jgi:hypothetical protein
MEAPQGRKVISKQPPEEGLIPKVVNRNPPIGNEDKG